MKVGIVIHSSRFFGGGNKFSADLASGLLEEGFDVAICAWDTPIKGASHKEFLEIEKWYVPKIKFNIGTLYKIIFNERHALKRLIKEFDPGVIINADSEPAVLNVGGKAKKIMFVHFPTELKIHAHTFKHELYRSIYWWQHYKSLRTIDAIVCNSNYTKEITYLMWKYSQPNKNNYHVIYPCVDTKAFSHKLPRQKKVCYVGRIDKNKGIETVINAFLRVKEDVPNATLEIVGGVKGSYWAEKYYPTLLSKVRRLKDVSLKIDVPSETIVETLATSRCMASFNREEHLGIVPIEAMASGTPPICAYGGGQLETIKNEETGFLVHNIDEMVHSMRLILLEDEVFEHMSRQAREHARLFDKNVFIEKWVDLIEGVTSCRF